MHTALLILQSHVDPAQLQKMILTFAVVLPFVFLVFLVIVMVPCWFICKKAGFTPWLSLLCAIPLGNLILLYVLAFTNWKVVPVTSMMPGQAIIPPSYPPPRA